MIDDLWSFLGTSQDRVSLSERDLDPRHVRLGKLGAMVGTVSHYLGFSAMAPEWIKEVVRSNLKKLGDKGPPMNPEVERKLREHYAPYNRALIDLLPEYESRIQSWGIDGSGETL